MSDEVTRLDRAIGGPFTYRHRGERRGLPSPLELDTLELRTLLNEGVNALPQDMPRWKAEALFTAWLEHYDLPTSNDAERLVYMVQRWRKALEADLWTHANADLGQLWRARRWRFLLNLIDHLPGHSFTAAATANDEEYAAHLGHAIAEAPEDESDDMKSPPVHRWTPEVAILADLYDTINRMAYAQLCAAVGGPQKAGPAPKPYPRPKTALRRAIEKATYDRKLAKHESLVARMLPHKRG